jgi:hemolysin III
MRSSAYHWKVLLFLVTSDLECVQEMNKKEELINALTHGLGAALAVAGLVLLIVLSCLYGNVWHIVSFSIFGATLVILYLASTLYHSFSSRKVKDLFRKFDHMSIFLLIAGSYTPFCLAVLQGWIGWTVFGIVWGCAVLGMTMKAFFTGKKELLSTIMYIVMGWAILPVIKPLYLSVPGISFVYLMLGGACYTAGTYFFMSKTIKYSHGIWHLFVLAGSVLHFFSVLSLLSI